MSNKKTVIIVEDDFLIAEYLRDLCDGYGMKVEGSADSAGAAIPMIMQKEPAYILMDVRLKGERDGVDVAHEIHVRRPGTKIIFITASSEPVTLDRIKGDHPHSILLKPINPDDLEAAFRL
ncbi:response regulator [Euryhalocaulis caribicus]|uniref:response regulator n=1 Tax=Euryhalocaulis caribicus TaxID=1161401 RepID=UPI00039D1FFD|nr:response regulator [Euryhalocaulis caribicus]